MNINDKLYGFSVTGIRDVKELESELYELKHDKSGARLVWLKNSQENKLFSIAFKTVPEDDTGVFHILEHSVLCGSDKYQVKEPFLELLKGSMNTFLNAMTFPDKTVYPVSSRNDKDFMNLMSVYMDAVFAPSILNNPHIFEQEGHHIEWRNESDEPIYKGVVFNEMKGALSSVGGRIENEMGKLLFPDNCYKCESGGDPQSIPDLTYEKFVKTYHRFYHPSNSYIYLDGDMDIKKVLEFLDGEYLSKYEKTDIAPIIPVQKQIKPVEHICYYEIARDEPIENRTHVAYGKVFSLWNEKNKQLASSVLCDVLAGSNDAPLKRALLDTGLCQDFSMHIEDMIAQPYLVLHIYNTNKESIKDISKAIGETVSKIISDGIDRDMLSAAIDLREFIQRDGAEPKALDRGINALSSWLYGGDPLLFMTNNDAFAFLREKLSSDYYEKLLAEMLQDENGMATLICLPSAEYGEELRKNEQNRIKSEIGGMSSDEKQRIIDSNKGLDEWQQNPDSPKALSSLPHLSLSDVSATPYLYKTTLTEQDGVKVLIHPSDDNEIVSFNLYFSVADRSEQEISVLAEMTDFLGQLPTENYSGLELQKKMTALFGDIQFAITVFSDEDNADECKPYFFVNARVLRRNADDALELLGEILTKTKYDNTDLIKELWIQNDEDMKQSIISGGHRFARNRVHASLSSESSVNELCTGYEAYIRHHDILKNIDERISDVADKIKTIYGIVFCKSRLTMSVTSKNETPIDSLLKTLPDGIEPNVKESHIRLSLPKYQGIVIPSSVSYSGAVLSSSVKDKAVWQVMSSILSYDFLWGEVRVKGGAYGVGAVLNKMNEMGFYSYRDPSPCKSISTFEKCSEFIREHADDIDLISYIISTVAKTEPLLSDSEKGTVADSLWFRRITDEKRVEIRKKMISVTKKDLLDCCEKLSDIGAECIIGTKDAMENCSDNFTIYSIH